MMDARSKPSYSEDLILDPLDHTRSYIPLGEAVYKSLKAAILDGRLRPGQLLIENKIAEKLNVSRTPVREALRMLDADNLVVFLPGRKVIVSIPTVQDIKEVYDIRLIFETEALRRITANHQHLIQEMEKYVQLAEKYRKQGDLRKMGEMNTRFHLAILSALENQRVQQFIDSLYETISRFRFYSLTPEWAFEREKEHKELVSLIKKGCKEEAAAVLQQHLAVTRENLIALFTQK
jgi:GntR family transcriptional regulator, trigonelline degradation regulator